MHVHYSMFNSWVKLKKKLGLPVVIVFLFHNNNFINKGFFFKIQDVQTYLIQR